MFSHGARSWVTGLVPTALARGGNANLVTRIIVPYWHACYSGYSTTPAVIDWYADECPPVAWQVSVPLGQVFGFLKCKSPFTCCLLISSCLFDSVISVQLLCCAHNYVHILMGVRSCFICPMCSCIIRHTTPLLLFHSPPSSPLYHFTPIVVNRTIFTKHTNHPLPALRMCTTPHRINITASALRYSYRQNDGHGRTRWHLPPGTAREPSL